MLRGDEFVGSLAGVGAVAKGFSVGERVGVQRGTSQVS
ncbi:hypothetical protein AAHH78_32665 [Burkholderia pseudomallei]